jgi:uncharacterized protein
MSRARVAITAALLLLGATAFAAESALPPSPPTHVLDEPGILSPRVGQALRALLAEHERITSEQVLVAVFKTLGEEDLVDFTSRVFSSWKMGTRGKDNGALLALYWNDRKARIEVGYGLEASLTDAKSKRILEDYLIPELRRGDADRALSLAALQILETIESPLIENGRAEQILRDGGVRGSFASRGFDEGAPTARAWWVWIVVGFCALFFAFQFITSAEAHFTNRGWYRPNPLQRVRRRGIWHSGGGLGGGGFGGFGGGGGGGGFLGGGGRSGGGGASGSW